MYNQINIKIMNKKQEKVIKYEISKEQYDTLVYVKQMIEVHKDTIFHLCAKEQDDIRYGFELGLINANLSQLHTDLIFLLSDVKK
jgi:hypothetical protein